MFAPSFAAWTATVDLHITLQYAERGTDHALSIYIEKRDTYSFVTSGLSSFK